MTALLIAAVAGACSSPQREVREPTPGVPVLAVLTYNVNFGLGGDPDTLDVIRNSDADLVLLQETTPRWEAALRRELSRKYPYMRFQHPDRYPAGGLAVLSRRPFEEKELTPSPSGWFPGWRKDREAEIAAYFTTLDPSLPTLVAGDFNESESGRAVGFLASRGFRSALPEFHPEQPTWRWNTSVGEIHQRLDHIVYEERTLEPLDARVVRGGRSDHEGVLARFQRSRSPGR